MNASRPHKLALLMVVPLLLLGILACDLGGAAAKPEVTVMGPPSGIDVREGEDVEVALTATDAKGVTRVELLVDGELHRTDASPDPAGAKSWTLVQTWLAQDPGPHTLTVVAYNVDDVASDPWAIAVRVTEGPPSEVTPTATSAAPPPPEATATATTEAPPAATATDTPPAPADTATATATATSPPALPDLVVIEFNVTPSDPAWGGSVHARIGILNQGNATSGPYKILFRWGSGGSDVYEWDKGPLPPNSGGIVEYDVPNVYASYNTVATVDSGDAVEESNEGNNSQQIAVTVGPPPAGIDLLISEIKLVPASPQQGSAAMVGVRVRNGGSVAAPAGYRVIWRSAGPTIGLEWTGPALAPGESRWLQDEYTYGGWNPNYTTTGIVDVDNDVAESNETNNELVLMVNVRPD